MTASMTVSIEERTVLEGREDPRGLEKEDLQSLKMKQDLVMDVLVLLISREKKIVGM